MVEELRREFLPLLLMLLVLVAFAQNWLGVQDAFFDACQWFGEWMAGRIGEAAKT